MDFYDYVLVDRKPHESKEPHADNDGFEGYSDVNEVCYKVIRDKDASGIYGRHDDPDDDYNRCEVRTIVYTGCFVRLDAINGEQAGWATFYGINDKRNKHGRVKGELQDHPRAELTAVNEALKQNLREAVRGEDYNILIATDSKYAINCSTIWGERWERNNYINSKKKPVHNADIIRRIRQNMQEIKTIRSSDVEFEYVFDDPGSKVASELVFKASCNWRR